MYKVVFIIVMSIMLSGCSAWFIKYLTIFGL
jgi:hypothetical protein